MADVLTDDQKFGDLYSPFGATNIGKKQLQANGEIFELTEKEVKKV